MDTVELTNGPGPTPEDAPSMGAPPRRRLLGDLLIREGLITRQQLDDALRAQAEAEEPRPIGEILVEGRVITRSQLDFVLEKYHKKYRLGDILVETNAITEEQLETALDHQRRTGLKLGAALLELKVLSERQMKEALCKQVRATFVDLDTTAVERRLTDLVPRAYAQQRRVLPVSQSADRLTVAMEDPADVEVIEELERATGFRIDVVTSTHAAFERAFRLYDERPAAAPPPSAAPAAEALARLQAECVTLRRERDETAQSLRQLEQRHAKALRAIRELEAREAEATRRLTELQAAHAELSEANAAAARALHEQRRQHEALLRKSGPKREDDFDAVLRQLGPPSGRRPPPRPR
jgi:hypothetical protein